MLVKIFDPKTFTSDKVIYFTAIQYPFNFFKLFFNYLKKQHNISPTNVFINTVADWQAFQSSLQISFLGRSTYYWLHELGVDSKTKQTIYKYLASYAGPHTVIIFVNSEESLPTEITNKINLDLKGQKEVANIVKLLPGANHPRIMQFIKKIHDKLGENLNIDQLCVLMQYGMLVRDLDEFDTKWLYQIVGSEQSLFELSKHFLFRDSVSFYKSWVLVADAYSQQFWITFFSEQLFRAYWFTIYQKTNNFRLAKQVGFRLSFDFMKFGWRYIDPALLIDAHNFLYQVDYQFKNGGSDIWLDAFFNKFFKGKIA